MTWPPDRSTTLLTVASGTLLFWLAASILGLHPDGAILGFSGTMWMLLGTTERDGKRRERRGQMDESSGFGDLVSPHEDDPQEASHEGDHSDQEP